MSLTPNVGERARGQDRGRRLERLDWLLAPPPRIRLALGLDSVLGDVAASFQGQYGLRGCRVVVFERDGSATERASVGVADGEMVSVPLAGGTGTVGRIDLALTAGQQLDASEEEVLKTFAA